VSRKIRRRTFLRDATIGVLSTVVPGFGQIQVPNSSGTGAPKLKAPLLACDCHHHIYDTAHFPPVQAGAIPNARVAEYRLLQRRLGTTRNIIVTPRPYGTDNRVTLDAIGQFGANARGVAVIDPTITDEELDALQRGGIRGIRFSLGANPTSAAVTTADMIEPLSRRVDRLGWHLQIQTEADQIMALKDLWPRLPTVLVFDHMGELPLPEGVRHPAFSIIRRLVDNGRAWVKLSVGRIAASYINPKDGLRAYADATKVAQAYVQAAPERMVWGSNWPHPNETTMPDDAVIFDLLSEWAPREVTRHRILVENPATLYGFPTA
jgi:D-galactarolactone isomerase